MCDRRGIIIATTGRLDFAITCTSASTPHATTIFFNTLSTRAQHHADLFWLEPDRDLMRHPQKLALAARRLVAVNNSQLAD